MFIPNIFVLGVSLLITNVSSFSISQPSRSVTTLSRKMAEQPPTSEINTKGATFPVPTEDLSIERVRQAIGASCTLTNERCEDGYLLRYGSKDDMPTLLSLLTSDDNIQDPESLARDFDLFQSVVVEQNGKVVGFAMTYWAYSTWEGRYLYANKIVAPNDTVETSLMYTLADVAVRLGGQRLVWQVPYNFLFTPMFAVLNVCLADSSFLSRSIMRTKRRSTTRILEPKRWMVG
jgi:hypothetical protein